MAQNKAKTPIQVESIKIKHVEVEVLPDGRMTLANAAKFLGFSRFHLYNRHLDEDMPPYVKVRKRIYYYYEDLVEWSKQFKKTIPKNKRNNDSSNKK